MGEYGETSGHQRHRGGAAGGYDFPTTGCHQTCVPSLKENRNRIEGASSWKERRSYWRRGKHPPPVKRGLQDSSAWWGGEGLHILEPMLCPSREPEAQREGLLTQGMLGTVPQAVEGWLYASVPSSKGWRGPPPGPGDLAVPEATARKCVRHLRKSLLYFHKIIITDACHEP